MNINEAYNQWSISYDTDRNRTRDLDQAVTRHCLAGLRCRTIIELGCGTGKNTALYARIGQAVHALDFSAGMIARARAKTTDHGGRRAAARRDALPSVKSLRQVVGRSADRPIR